ncbi:MAG: cyclase family protein [Candidatus Hydrogenedentota bacterium]
MNFKLLRMPLMAAGIVLAIGIAGGNKTAAQEKWYPSKHGADDTLGAINFLSPEKVVEAAKLIKTGKTYALGVELGRETPGYGTRTFQLFAVGSGDGSGATQGKNKMTANDDWIMMWLGIGSQIDGLGHLGIDHRYYNGTHISEFWVADGLTKFGIDTLPPIVTRGVLLDIAAYRGEKMMKAGTAINRKDIEGAMNAQKIEIGKGDVVILNTGWQALATSDPEKFLSGQPGLGVEGAKFLASKDVVAIGADQWGLEVIPGEDSELLFPVHQELLAKNGIYILENMKTDELVADKAWEFLFVLGQPKLKGAVQGIINPVAIR